jgi:hypothetical protein
VRPRLLAFPRWLASPLVLMSWVIWAVAPAHADPGGAPVNTAVPAISGVARAGSTLTASKGEWSGATPMSFRYQWQRCQEGGAVCADVPGATGSTYTATDGDRRTTLRVRVTAANAHGAASAVSDVTARVQGSRGSPQLTQVDGGPLYYGKFAHGLPTGPGYFPIGAWFRSACDQAQIDAYVDFGMNLFVGVENPPLDEHGNPSPCGANMPLVGAVGMKALVQINERHRFNNLGSETAGWLLDDEVDMRFGPGWDIFSPGPPPACTPDQDSEGCGYSAMQYANDQTPSDGRVRYANYGKGVGWWETDEEAETFVNDFQRLVSIDAYWFTDPNERPPAQQGDVNRYGRAASYGWSVERMRDLDGMDGRRMPIWNFVETGWPFTESAEQGGRRILPAEARAAAWHSIIAGARGIIYFDHQFGGPCTETVIRGECYPDTRGALKATNRQIKRLAPVLNSPSVTSGWSTNGPVTAMVKWYDGHLYVFAGSLENASSTGTFSMPCVRDATAVRLGEPGSVPVDDGSFSDTFADGNAIHIYRIDGGSACGLV